MVEELDRYDDLDDELEEDPRYSENPYIRRKHYLKETIYRLEGLLGKLQKDVNGVGDAVRAIFENPKNYVIASSRVLRDFARATGNQELENKLQALVKQVWEHCESLGIRYSSQLLSPSEHDAIGSTIWFKYGEVDAEVPTSITHAQLIDDGEIEDTEEERARVMTIEEVNNARQLHGMTMLDLSTGRLTQEINEEAANNRFYFVPIEDRPDLLAAEAAIVADFEKLAADSLVTIQMARPIVYDIVAFHDGDMSLLQLLDNVEALKRRFPKSNIRVFDQIMSIFQANIALGIYDRFLTPQEILLRCGGEVDERYLENPYIPLAVQDGASIDSVRLQRRGLMN